MPVCSVSTCRNSSTTTGDSDIFFHSFPRNDKRALEWFMKCKRRDKRRPNSVDRVCSIHFQPEMYERDIGHELLGKPPTRKLKETATPTLNLPFIFIKPSEARKVLTPTLARNLNKRVPQSLGSATRKPNRNVSALSSSSRVGGEENGGQGTTSETGPSSETNPFDQIVILKCEAHCLNLLGEMFNDEAFMDLTLVVQHRRIRAHKVILRQASGYFKKNLNEEMSNSNNTSENEVAMENITYEDLTKIVAFIYHGEVSIKATDLDRFLEATEFLEIRDLKKPDQDSHYSSTNESSDKRKYAFGKRIKFSYTSRGRNGSKTKGKYCLSSLASKDKSESQKPPQKKKKIVNLAVTELRDLLVTVLSLLY